MQGFLRILEAIKKKKEHTLRYLRIQSNRGLNLILSSGLQ